MGGGTDMDLNSAFAFAPLPLLKLERVKQKHFPQVFRHLFYLIWGVVGRVNMHSAHDLVKSLSITLFLSFRQTRKETWRVYSKYLNTLDSSEHLMKKGQYMIKRPADVQGCLIRTCVWIKDTLWRCPEEYLWSSCGTGILRGWKESLACLNWRAPPERRTLPKPNTKFYRYLLTFFFCTVSKHFNTTYTLKLAQFNYLHVCVLLSDKHRVHGHSVSKTF